MGRLDSNGWYVKTHGRSDERIRRELEDMRRNVARGWPKGSVLCGHGYPLAPVDEFAAAHGWRLWTWDDEWILHAPDRKVSGD